MARIALKLGGFEKVRKLTVYQAKLLIEAITDEQMFIAKVHGAKVEGETSEEEVAHMGSFSEVFNALKGNR